MILTDVRVDWLGWYDRWEHMLSCYNPGREARVHLMLTIPELPEEELNILDLGAGPGCTSFSVLRQHAGARVVAVEADPVLVRMGQAVIAQRRLGDRIRYLHADLRDPDWWRENEGEFDLVVSATALHWLSEPSYQEVCRRIHEVLKPGGWFMNFDHVASGYPELQARYNAWREQRVQRAFAALEADRWDDYWTKLLNALAEAGGTPIRCEDELWEGSDEGHPKPVHLDALMRAGFELSDVYWQELGEAILGGQKPID